MSTIEHPILRKNAKVGENHLRPLTQKGSWTSTLGKVGLSAAAVAMISHLIYQNQISPSRESHHPDSSALTAFFQQYASDCNSTTFKVMQGFLNTFETAHSLISSLGLNTRLPPGDIQAFTLDQNFEALDCALASYPEDRVTIDMKNKLLGRVLRQIQVHHKDLVEAERWLIKWGASVHHQEPISSKDNVGESTFTPLMTAYRTLNPDLYEWLLSRGAHADMPINSYNPTTGAYNQYQTLFGAIIEDIKAQPKLLNRPYKNLDEAYRCPKLKRIVDASISNIVARQGLDVEQNNKLRVRTYMNLNKHACVQTFACTKEEQADFQSDELASVIQGLAKEAQEFARWFQKPENVEYPQDESMFKQFAAASYQGVKSGAKYAYDSGIFSMIGHGLKSTANKTVEYGGKAASLLKSTVNTTANLVVSAYNSSLGKGVKTAFNYSYNGARRAYDLSKSAWAKGQQISSDVYHSEIFASISDKTHHAAQISQEWAKTGYKKVLQPVGKMLSEAPGKASHALSETAKTAQEYVVLPASRAIKSSAEVGYNHVFVPAKEALSSGANLGYEKVLRPAGEMFSTVPEKAQWATTNTVHTASEYVFKPAGSILQSAAFKSYEHAIKPAGQVLSSGSQMGYEHLVKPAIGVAAELPNVASAAYDTWAEPLGSAVSAAAEVAKEAASGAKDYIVSPAIDAASDAASTVYEAIADATSSQSSSTSVTSRRR